MLPDQQGPLYRRDRALASSLHSNNTPRSRAPLSPLSGAHMSPASTNETYRPRPTIT